MKSGMEQAMKDCIHIGRVEVPVIDYAVSCNAILGIRDSGKTVTAKGIAEQLIEHDIPIVVFDAVGKWRWMKVAGDGPHGKGYKVVVAGGKGPDLALSPQSVGEIVRSAIREKIPLVIDLYDPRLSKADWRRIVRESIHIIHYEANGVVHVFLEEAAEFVPQKVMDGETYAEVEKLARMGGNASVGITLINQRSQEVNKAVLDLSSNLILGCQIGNKAIEAVEKWVDRLAPEVAKEVTTSLPHLKSGEAWVWTRSNPAEPTREKMPMCRSLHPDRRTPEVVLKSAKPADIHSFVERLTAAIPKLIEETKANDPQELRREIARLNKEIKKSGMEKAAAPAKVEIKEVPVLSNKIVLEMAKLSSVVATAEAVCVKAFKLADELNGQLRVVYEKLTTKSGIVRPVGKPKVFSNVNDFRRERTAHKRPAREMDSVDGRDGAQRSAPPTSDGKLPIGEQKILAALIHHPDGLQRNQLTVLTGYKRSSRDAYIARLKEKNFVLSNGENVEATNEGMAALPDAEPLPKGEELQEYYRTKLPQGELALLTILMEAYPQSVDRETLTQQTNYQRSSRDAYLARLKARQLVTEPSRGMVRASEDLF